MSEHESNGKATASFVATIITTVAVTLGLIASVATPLILMYSKLNAMEVQFGERLQEIETQFKAADDFRNINLAQQSRVNALMWRQAYGVDFPQELYYPAIAKPR